MADEAGRRIDIIVKALSMAIGRSQEGANRAKARAVLKSLRLLARPAGVLSQCLKCSIPTNQCARRTSALFLPYVVVCNRPNLARLPRVHCRRHRFSAAWRISGGSEILQYTSPAASGGEFQVGRGTEAVCPATLLRATRLTETTFVRRVRVLVDATPCK